MNDMMRKYCHFYHFKHFLGDFWWPGFMDSLNLRIWSGAVSFKLTKGVS